MVRSIFRWAHAVVYALFLLFCAAMLMSKETDLLLLTVSKFFGRVLAVWAVLPVITVLAMLMSVQMIVSHLFRFKGRRYALSCVPSLLLLALICGWGRGVLFFALLLLAVGIYVWLITMRRRGWHSYDTFWTLLRPNLWCLLLSFAFVALYANTDETFHYELRIERLLMEGRAARALHVGEKSLATGHRLTALRAFALSKEGRLGDRLFTYPLAEGQTDLFLYPDDEKDMLPPLDSLYAFWGFRPQEGNGEQLLAARVDEGATPKAIGDYWLCTLLLRGQLDAFVEWLPRWYEGVEGPDLPEHYREALLLYRHRAMSPLRTYDERPEDLANYRDFVETMKAYNDPVERKNRARRLYGDTYYWYYFFSLNQVNTITL